PKNFETPLLGSILKRESALLRLPLLRCSPPAPRNPFWLPSLPQNLFPPCRLRRLGPRLKSSKFFQAGAFAPSDSFSNWEKKMWSNDLVQPPCSCSDSFRPTQSVH